MKVRYFALAAVLAASSCAKRPDAIVPVDIPMAAYSNQSCQGLAQELVKEQATLCAGRSSSTTPQLATPWVSF
ncbi:hypothetical protein D3C87_1430910 [compost metagenome]